MKSVELVLDSKAKLGEGAAWVSERRRLYWVDIMGKAVHSYDPVTGTDQVIDVGQQVGTLAPRASGGLVLALEDGIYFLDESDGNLEKVVDPEENKPTNRFNDGKCDPAGRFWAGTMSMVGQGQAGSLYRLDPDHSIHKMVGEVTTSNGLTWSLDRMTMYYIDTPTKEVSAFDYDHASGKITNRRTAVAVQEGDGRPDGMTIDAEGMLWVAMWEGWQVNRYDPATGSKLSSIPVPAARVTSVAFAGDSLEDLYITTARLNLDGEELANQPHAGGLFKAVPGVKGVEGFAFLG